MPANIATIEANPHTLLPRHDQTPNQTDARGGTNPSNAAAGNGEGRELFGPRSTQARIRMPPRAPLIRLTMPRQLRPSCNARAFPGPGTPIGSVCIAALGVCGGVTFMARRRTRGAEVQALGSQSRPGTCTRPNATGSADGCTSSLLRLTARSEACHSRRRGSLMPVPAGARKPIKLLPASFTFAINKPPPTSLTALGRAVSREWASVR